MSARHWSDAWRDAAELADRLDTVGQRSPILTTAAAILRDEPCDVTDVAVLAEDLDELADCVAKRWGAYEDHAAIRDAADALRELRVWQTDAE